jgi:hypothetical protein
VGWLRRRFVADVVVAGKEQVELEMLDVDIVGRYSRMGSTAGSADREACLTDAIDAYATIYARPNGLE